MKKVFITLSLVLLVSIIPACNPKTGTLTPTVQIDEIEGNKDVQSVPEEEPLSSDEIVETWIQIELITTSDWADLFLLESEKILSYEIVSLLGEPTFHYGGGDKLTLEQPIEAAQSGVSVGITVKYKLAEGVFSLDFKSQRGGINENQIRIFDITREEPLLMLEVDHDQIHDNDGTWNFSLVLIH